MYLYSILRDFDVHYLVDNNYDKRQLSIEQTEKRSKSMKDQWKLENDVFDCYVDDLAPLNRTTDSQ